jgi:hypothetical protein
MDTPEDRAVKIQIMPLRGFTERAAGSGAKRLISP